MADNTFFSPAVPPRFQTYDEVIAHLQERGLFHVDLGLERMHQALGAWGLEYAFCPLVQIVGTNGKGSTSTFLQAIAMAHGLTVGLYTSPHFVYPEERIRINGRMLPRERWPWYANRALAACEDLTYFELLTCMAADAFRQEGCDLVVCEAGLGGRYDGTSALPADMVCFTPIGMDHMDVLGQSLAEIADDKSDALRSGVYAAVSAPQVGAVQTLLEDKATRRHIPLCACPSPQACQGNADGRTMWRHMPEELTSCAVLPADAVLGLHGLYQRSNAQTALLAWTLLCYRYGWRTDAATIAKGLKQAFLPGRFQFVPARGELPALWLDGAHNTHGMRALKTAVEALPERQRPGAVVFSCLRDKHPEQLSALVRSLAGAARVFVPTIPDNPRAALGEEIAAFVGEQATAVADLPTALREAANAAAGHPVLICGSLYLLSAFFSLYPAALEGNAAALSA